MSSLAITGGLSGANAQATPRARLEAAGKAFEAVFMRQMIASMRSASLGDDILGSSAGDQFRDMADARTADAMVDKGGLGIAKLLVDRMSAGHPELAAPPAGEKAK